MNADCLFCKIAAKKIPSKIVYEDDEVFAFEDISPQAPTHVLICPRKHFTSLHEASPEDQAVLGKLQLVAAQLARKRDLLEGYRTVVNNGSPYFICTCIYWVGGIFAGPRDSLERQSESRAARAPDLVSAQSGGAAGTCHGQRAFPIAGKMNRDEISG